MRKLVNPSRSIKRIYIVIYDQQEFFGYDTTTPVKAFKTKKMADIYASTRNFEFQSVCLLDEEDFESYVLGNSNSDFVVSISDFRDAHAFVSEEIARMEKSKTPVDVWGVLDTIVPFKVVPIEYITELKGH
jgi:hypothetical protein